MLWYTGVPQCIVVHWSTPVCCGTLEYPSVLWYTGVPQYTVVRWSTPVYPSILWYTGVPQCTVVHWSTPVYCGTLEQGRIQDFNQKGAYLKFI